MTLLYSDACFLDHDTAGHPERALRLRRVTAHLEHRGLAQRCRQASWQPIALERLARVHSLDYAAAVQAFAAAGGGQIEQDTVVSRKSYEVARQAAGAVADAVVQVVGGGDSQALCLVRPPGHHALPGHAMGFCLFNNVAIGARVATAELNLDRVLIVDWDVHHGNGTQDMFWNDGQTGFFSIHRWPFYPGTGRAEETGSGAGSGATLNLPIEMGISRKGYRDQFASHLAAFAERLKPQLILLSAGFDSHREDPVGSLGLETEDFADLTRTVLDVARTHANGRLVSVLEGGYHVDRLADCVGVHLETMLDATTETSAEPGDR